MTEPNPSPPPALPVARLKRGRTVSLLWFLPLLAVLLSAWLGYRAWTLRGIVVSVSFERGHGLKAGDEVRYRGISIGEVRAVRLAESGDGISVRIGLDPEARRFARKGSLFWIVRPQVSLAGVRGVETLLGTRYLAALPGSDGGSELQRAFSGLEQPRVVDSIDPGDLEIILEGSERGNLDVGTAITYREVQIGTVLSVGLSADSRTVEARAHIERAYVPLVRERTRFYFAGGVGANFGTRLLWMEFEGNLARLGLGGSVALATPPDGGRIATTGQRFRLWPEADEAWLEWSPSIAVGNAHLPASAVLPAPLRARLTWRQGLFKREQSRSGWLLQTERGLIGPADLLSAPPAAVPGSARLEAAGQVVASGVAEGIAPGLALLDARVQESSFPWPEGAPPAEPIDCVVLGDRPETPLSLPAHRLSAGDGVFHVDGAVTIEPRWHGGLVLARETGVLIGFLLVEERRIRVALLAGPSVTDSGSRAAEEH